MLASTHAMNIQHADDVWTRIAEAQRQLAAGDAPTRGVVATDADGTLWSGDVGEDLFHAFIERGTVHPPALEAMRREAREHALSDAGTGPEVARRIYEAYVAGSYPEERACELMTWCFAGHAREDVAAFARETVQRVGLEGRMHPEVLRVLERARAAGIEVLLVSASPIAIVVAAGTRAGFDGAHTIAARPRFDGDVMLPDVERPIPYGPGKVKHLRDRIGGRTLLAAFGDNAFDVAMLASARIGVAVRPKPRLRDRAAEVPGLVELAPET